MKVDSQRILVCSPPSVTGGPELLHQLVHELRGLGRDAYISYYPFDRTHAVPEPYRMYQTPVASFQDAPDTFVVMPETATWIARHVKRSRAAVWWMSVDNYFEARRESWIADQVARYRALAGGRTPFFRLRRFGHFVQSEYARQFLQGHGLAASPLTDYLNPQHLARAGAPPEDKRNIVVYNPRKGIARSERLMARYPDIEFVPLQNMTAAEVGTLLGKAKVYMDFGHHPGKDRAPREAAVAGCCVLTGRQGAAGNGVDIPIPAVYKLDDASNAYLEDFGPLVLDVFRNFATHASAFEAYRRSILGERENFERQVRAIFG